MNRPGVSGDFLVLESDVRRFLVVSVVSLLCLYGCEVVAVLEWAVAVEPARPFSGGDFQVVEAFPRSALLDQFSFVEPDH